VVHGVFKSSAIDLDNGITSIEYTFNSTNNTTHNNVLSAKHESLTDNSNDALLSELYDYNNEILIKGPSNAIVKIQVFAEVSFNTPANEVNQIFYTNLTPNNSTLLTQFKTVSLLI